MRNAQANRIWNPIEDPEARSLGFGTLAALSDRVILFIVYKAVGLLTARVSTRADHLGEKIGIVIHLVRHISTDVEEDFEKFWAAIHGVSE